MTRIVCCGEGMLELARRGGRWDLSYGGDTLNTAIHLARLGENVAYLTALGDDPFSAQLKQEWRAEALDTTLALRHPTRIAGLYAVTTDSLGERSFTYWREASAAREMFELEGSEAAVAQATRADLLYFSLITLAILTPVGRKALLRLAEQVRANGGDVAYDNNFRARLWTSSQDAVHVHEAAISVASLGLPTLEDETAITLKATEPSRLQEHWAQLGCGDVVVKLGPDGCMLPSGDVIAPDNRLTPVDTSGAGDAFNAGYLSAHLRAKSAQEAALSGHRLAGWVISHPGALPARDADSPYA